MKTAHRENSAGRIEDNRIEQILPLFLAAPSTILVLLLIAAPILFEIVLSFSQRDAFTGEQHLIGSDNYTRILRDPAFWEALRRTGLYALTTTSLQVLLGVLMAFYVFLQPRRIRTFLRAICFLPYVVSIVAAVIVFEFLFDGETGILTLLTERMGFSSDWHSGNQLFMLLVIISVWQFTPFVFLIVLARLETIPVGILEAAQADGASTTQLLWRIILPQLRETLIATVLLRLIFMFTKFDTPWLLAGGKGTNRYVETLPIYSFRQAFENFQLGDAAASGMLLFLATAFITGLVIRLSGKKRKAA